ncbi:MAG: SGNH/GDSL hydrolase family protein [Verrucomicrobiota bacterium]
MKMTFNFLRPLTMASAVVLLAGCAAQKSLPTTRTFQTGESVVLIGEEPAQLAFAPLRREPIRLRNTYRDLPATIHYEKGRDFTIDYRHGQIRRTAPSRIPDFRTNVLFGIEDFDHGKFPGYGNGKFFVFVDYAAKNKIDWPKQPSQIEFLSKTRAKLQGGEHLKIIAFGDSITAGGEATGPKLIFWQRWADALQEKYPRAKIDAVNGATGGDRTVEGLARLPEKVLSQHPDLVLIAFGMNDHNIGGTPLEVFTNNLAMMVDRIRKETGAEIILLSTFPPNPKWHYGSHRMEAYALAMALIAREKQCAYADIYHNWIAIESKKKPEDLLSNNINHPNDFGHWIYFEVLQGIGL